MQHFLTDKVRLMQIALRLSIFWTLAGIWAIGATAPHSQSWANGSWQWASSPMNCSPEGHHRITCGFKREGTRTDGRRGVSFQRTR